MKMYWLNTKKYCGGVSVDDVGFICGNGTAPCYKYYTGKKFLNILEDFRRKKFLISCQELKENDSI
jgi:hypothetical protein